MTTKIDEKELMNQFDATRKEYTEDLMNLRKKYYKKLQNILNQIAEIRRYKEEH